jgi:hypothetical protein
MKKAFFSPDNCMERQHGASSLPTKIQPENPRAAHLGRNMCSHPFLEAHATLPRASAYVTARLPTGDRESHSVYMTVSISLLYKTWAGIDWRAVGDEFVQRADGAQKSTFTAGKDLQAEDSRARLSSAAGYTVVLVPVVEMLPPTSTASILGGCWFWRDCCSIFCHPWYVDVVIRSFQPAADNHCENVKILPEVKLHANAV